MTRVLPTLEVEGGAGALRSELSQVLSLLQTPGSPGLAPAIERAEQALRTFELNAADEFRPDSEVIRLALLVLRPASESITPRSEP